MKLTKKEVADYVAQQLDISKKLANEVMDEIISTIKEALKDPGDEVTISGFGKWKVKTRAASNRRNPRTGEILSIPERNAVVHKVALNFKKSVQ